MYTLVPKEGHRFILTLCQDDESLREVHLFIFGNKIPTDKTIEQLEYEGAKRYVLRKLAQRSLASAQLKTSLKRYLVSESVIQQVLEECVEKGYLNDQQWIESFISGQLNRRAGPAAIKQKLLMKGLSIKAIEDALHRMDSSENCQERIKSLLETRYKTKDLKNFKERQKVIASLMRKGFELEDIYETLTISTFD